MAFRQRMAVVRVQRVDHGRAGIGGPGWTRRAAIKQDARSPLLAVELLDGKPTGDVRRGRTAPGRSHADQVEQATLCLSDDWRRQVLERQFVDESRHLERSAVRRADGRRNIQIGLRSAQRSPFDFKKSVDTCSTVFLSTSTEALSLPMMWSSSLADRALSGSANLGFLSSVSLRTTGVIA